MQYLILFHCRLIMNKVWYFIAILNFHHGASYDPKASYGPKNLVKGIPITGHEGPWGMWMQGSTYSQRRH